MASQSQVLTLQHENKRFFGAWIFSTNHKVIGINYLVTAFFFFAVGGIEALLIRVQLGAPNNTVLTPEQYNQVFTMHGTTMIFLFAMPVLVGFANYLVPLMIGAQDMAFPRLNALSYWLFLFGGLVLYSSFVLGGAPDAGWFAYAPLTTVQYSASHGMDFWVLGIILTGVGSTVGAINFVVTILNLRAPGMSMFRMPVFVWMMLVTVFIMLFALPAVTVDAILLFIERNFGALFFQASAGGDPLLWQNLFWFFGHPEVYILILPAFGIISEVIPVFSRKPIFGYAALVYSGIAIGFLGFTVWAHHMFAVGLNPVADAVFGLDSMIIAVPTSIKIFNWIATLWDGKINLKSPVLYAIGFIAMFVIGGLSGVSLAIVPVDWQMEDTYYVVAHLHYVLFGGTVFAVFAGVYYWFPKITGRLLSDRLGKWQFWIMLVSFNLTFFPMHLLGLMGMPRRVYTYDAGTGWTLFNQIETVGAFLIAVAMLLFAYNLIKSLRGGEKAGNDPWEGQTLEWTTSSPPPANNFAKIPTIHGRRPAWDMKQKPALQTASEQPEPSSSVEASGNDLAKERSFYPTLLALGLMVASYGLIYTVWLSILGLAIAFIGIIGWVNEPV
ncbi:MAG TPA: cytochrome c oxidase subunit I [Anaerolineaceae bacterium]|nr:cytochrome c oxidase subunit I [Anaerolineaceae bacterium]